MRHESDKSREARCARRASQPSGSRSRGFPARHKQSREAGSACGGGNVRAGAAPGVDGGRVAVQQGVEVQPATTQQKNEHRARG